MRLPLVLRRAVRGIVRSAALLLPLAPSAQAQQHAPTPQPTISVPLESIEGRTVHPALWKVADADTTIWLFGTIHALPKGVNWLNGPVEAALEGSGELVTELPDIDPASSAAVIVAKGTLPPGQTLRGLLGKKDAAKLEAALARYKQPPEALDRLKPWYAAIVLAALPRTKAGVVSAQGVEAALASRAKAAGKPRIGLETMGEQLDMFDTLSAKQQKRLLLDAISDDGEAATELNKMVDQWGSGAVDALAKSLRDNGLDGALGKVLIEQRNARWTAWLQQRLAQPGTIFVAVGAGHLAGKGSVVDSLQKRGIAVTRVQ
jgi:uncharacterized protein YbaP (TraB family)